MCKKCGNPDVTSYGLCKNCIKKMENDSYNALFEKLETLAKLSNMYLSYNDLEFVYDTLFRLKVHLVHNATMYEVCDAVIRKYDHFREKSLKDGVADFLEETLNNTNKHKELNYNFLTVER